MAELNNKSSMPAAPTSLVPFKATSAQITGLPTSPNLAENADLALPDHGTQGTAYTDHRADDDIHLSASRQIAQFSECKLHDINVSGDAMDRISEDKPVINGQLESISLQRNAQEVERKCRPLKKLKCEGRNYSPQEAGEEEEGGESACVTPTAREQRIPQEILRCPPPPCKKRHYKRKSCDAMAAPSASSSSTPQLPAEQAQAAALHLVVSPPDLHTFPDCFRALFFPN